MDWLASLPFLGLCVLYYVCDKRYVTQKDFEGLQKEVEKNKEEQIKACDKQHIKDSEAIKTQFHYIHELGNKIDRIWEFLSERGK